MASPQFDSNAWYSLQNMGTNAYLGCNSISICGADGSDLSTFERFQINTAGANPAYYLRPEARNVDENGQPFCINLSSGQPALALCEEDSATWGTGYWNGADAGDGLYFFDTQRGDSRRLFLNESGTWSLLNYTEQSPDDQNSMRWSTSSLAAINDQSYSTVPSMIATSVSAPTTVATPTTNVNITISSLISGSTSDSTSSTQSIPPSTSTMTFNTTVGPPSTATVVQTPTFTVPGTHSSSSTSTSTSTSPTPSPTLRSGAGKTVLSTYGLAALAVIVAAPQLMARLS